MIHQLCVFADVIQEIPDFCVIVIDIAAAIFSAVASREIDRYLSTVRNRKLQIVVWIDESDTLFSLPHMLIQPLFCIAETVYVRISFVRIQPKHIGMLFCIQPKSELMRFV